MIKAIFRDFDGTIGDTLDLVIEAANQLAKKYHRKDIPDQETFRSQSMRTVVQRMWIHRRQVLFFVWKIRKYIQKHQDEIQTFPGLKDIYTQLSHTYTTWIITTNKISTVKAFFYHHGFSPNGKIDNCRLWNKAKKIKKMIRNNHLNAHEVIYIGDEVRDIHSCKEIGIKIIAVSRWYDNETLLKENNPDILITKPRDILQAIEQLEKEEKTNN